jgi:cobalt/nickel transport system ATP-binding protein
MDIAALDRWAVQGKSRIHSASPLGKLAATMLFIACVAIARDVLTLVTLYTALAALVVVARLPLRRTLMIAAYPAIFAVLFAFSQWNGQWATPAVIVLKAMDAGLAMVLLISSTPYPQLFAVIGRTLPRVVADALLLTYRSFFLLLEEMDHLITALRLRGGLLRGRPMRTIRNLSVALGVLLVRSFDLGQRLYETLMLRGYAGRFPSGGNWKRLALSYDGLPVIVGLILLAMAIASQGGRLPLAFSLTAPLLAGVVFVAAIVERHGLREPARPHHPATEMPPAPGVWQSDHHVEDEPEPFDHVHPEAAGKEIIAHVSCVRHTYSDSTTVSLCGLDFIVTAAQRVVILGPNGSGKSTLLYHLLGLLRPDEGVVRLFGHDPAQHWSAVREKVGVVLQNVDEQILAPTVYDDIAFSPRNYGHSEDEVKALVEKVIGDLSIAHLRDKVPHYLSGGEKRKVALAGALVLEPQLLIMDEPFEGLDPKSRDELIALLNRLHENKHVSFILTTHEVDIVPQLADSVYMLVQGGEIVEHGTPRRLFSRADVLARSNIEPPVLARLFETLRDCGLDVGGSPLTVDEAAQRLMEWASRTAPGP